MFTTLLTLLIFGLWLSPVYIEIQCLTLIKVNWHWGSLRNLGCPSCKVDYFDSVSCCVGSLKGNHHFCFYFGQPVKVKLRQSSPVFKNSLALGMAEDGGSSPRRKCCHDIKIHLFFFSFDFSKQFLKLYYTVRFFKNSKTPFKNLWFSSMFFYQFCLILGCIFTR